MTTSTLTYSEETFGILTDDQLYLDCVFVKPPNTLDEDLRGIRVWVPKYPLTKSSVITCARQEVQHSGEKRKIAHLVFDLRGTGDSDGVLGDQNFDLDLHAVQEWAKERFGKISFRFLGTPFSEYGRVNMWPLRPGSIMESYHYPAVTEEITPPTILYLSSYGNFTRSDDLVCTRLAKAGSEVFGLDPLRYLLHASANGRLRPEDLESDLHILIQMLPSRPIVIGQPLAAGLALMWASRVTQIKGVISIGNAQAGLSPNHIFYNNNPYTYMLSRYVKNIAPRPLALVMLNKHSLGGDEQEIDMLYKSSQNPHRLEKEEKLSFKLLSELISWVSEH